jgi:hypothetical protein
MTPTPEEKLLRLIRGKGTRQAAEGTMPAPAGGAAAATRLPGAPPGRARRAPSLRAAIGFLGAVLGVELVLLLVQVLRPLPTVTVPVVIASPVERAAVPEAPAAPEAPDVPSVAAAASRPLFAPPAASAVAEPSRPSGSSIQLASRLTLMGIVAGHPAQAIIGDSQTQKTYFVNEGQSVVEGAVLEQVLDNHVVLSLAGERFELSL